MKNIAFDLGGSGGKMVLGEYTGDTLTMHPLHRFKNRQINLNNSLYWNFMGIYENLLEGISKAYAQSPDVKSVGIDSFSNDFGFIDPNGVLISQVHCYRDPRTLREEDKIYAKLSKEQLYQMTGNQNALFNTAMQLAAMVEEGKGYFFENGNTMLLLPDLLGYFLTRQKRAEYSIASVTQMFDFKTTDWNPKILDAFGINKDMLPPIASSGTVLGSFTKEMQEQLGIGEMQVVSVCGHDTASAVASLPTNKKDVAFISSGTWSLFGTEVDAPIITDQTFRGNFANEGGAENRCRLLKNIMGLWLVQECRHTYALQGQDYSYDDLEQLARREAPFRSLIDPDDDLFYMPGNMPKKIALKCAQTGQPMPETPGQTIRCIIESLALKYRWALDQIEGIVGKELKEIYILGGGGQDNMLNQYTANACNRPVFAGPTEAALCGNLLMQLYAYGEIGSLREGRDLIARSFTLKSFEPTDVALWNEAFQRFKKMFSL